MPQYSSSIIVVPVLPPAVGREAGGTLFSARVVTYRKVLELAG